MATWHGDHEDLQFVCGSCDNNYITVNPENKNDMEELGLWLMTHSANGGHYESVPSKKGLKEEIVKKEKELAKLKKQLKKQGKP